MFGSLAKLKETWVEISGQEKKILLRVNIGAGEVPCWIFQALGRSKTSNSILKPIFGEERACRFQGDVAEAKGLIQIRLNKVGTRAKIPNKGTVNRKAGQNDTVRDVGILIDKSVCLSGAKRMTTESFLDIFLTRVVKDASHSPNMNHFGELLLDLRKFAFA